MTYSPKTDCCKFLRSEKIPYYLVGDTLGVLLEKGVIIYNFGEAKVISKNLSRVNGRVLDCNSLHDFIQSLREVQDELEATT